MFKNCWMIAMSPSTWAVNWNAAEIFGFCFAMRNINALFTISHKVQMNNLFRIPAAGCRVSDRNQCFWWIRAEEESVSSKISTQQFLTWSNLIIIHKRTLSLVMPCLTRWSAATRTQLSRFPQTNPTFQQQYSIDFIAFHTKHGPEVCSLFGTIC